MLSIVITSGMIVGFASYSIRSTTDWPKNTSIAWNEFIFEKRNKSYGAYQIRNKYNTNLILITLGLTLGTIVFYLFFVFFNHQNTIKRNPMHISAVNSSYNLNDPEKKVIIRKTTRKQTQPPKTTSNVFNKITTEQLKLDTVGPSGEGEFALSEVLPRKQLPQLPPREIIFNKSDINGVPDSITEVASFVGGRPKMFEFIADYTRLRRRGYATVEVEFLINKEGKVEKVWVEKRNKDCPECDEAAISVIKKMPDWVPATKNGAPVNSYYHILITFR